ncbi:MAG: pyridoxal phosphate-dependent aminotransferase [Planctomycetes bacterium]|nr:pyridoxal phosphate-dependent aminotransferase [Planctomycetota bacterium]
MKLSKRVQRIKPSVTLALTAKARALREQGKDVIPLTAGEPDFETPAVVRKAAIAEIEKGGKAGRYTAAAGLPELLTAVAKKFERDNGLKYATDQCIVSCGAKHSIFNAIASVVDDGDEVIVPAPYWVSYPEMLNFLGAKPVIVDTSTTGFVLTPEALKRAITPRTRAIFVNTPSNPTGTVWNEAQQRAIADVLKGTDIVVISDEIYEKLVYEGTHVSFAAVSPDAYARTVTINGVAKAYAMTGWRIGYSGGPKNIIQAMIALQSHSTSNPTTLSQLAALTALQKDPEELPQWRECYRKRRDMVVEAMNAMPGVKCAKPGGAFYVFPDVRGWVGKRAGDVLLSDDAKIGEALLAQALVAVVPGGEFGAPGFLRLSYAVSDESIAKAMGNIRDFANKLR